MLEVRQILRNGKPPTLLEWFRESYKIDMNPSFQRRANLWGLEKRKLLINTFLNDYDMPKIYLADYTDYPDSPLKKKEVKVKRRPDASESLYSVIDGKQRLRNIFDFFEDKLPLGDTPVFAEGETYHLRGKTYSDLNRDYPRLARRVENFRPTVMSVIADDRGDIKEMFIRLNVGEHISGPERRNAMRGPLPRLIRSVAEHEFFISRALFSIQRGQDLNTAAKFLLMESREGFVNTKRLDLDRFVLRNVANEPQAFDEIVTRVEATLDLMASVFSDKDELLRGQAQMPIYYWLIRKRVGPPTQIIATVTNYDLVRAFLSDFENKRQEVRSLMTRRSRGEDILISAPELINYNTLMRTPDDKRNQEGMYRILNQRYDVEVADVLEKLK